MFIHKQPLVAWDVTTVTAMLSSDHIHRRRRVPTQIFLVPSDYHPADFMWPRPLCVTSWWACLLLRSPWWSSSGRRSWPGSWSLTGCTSRSSRQTTTSRASGTAWWSTRRESQGPSPAAADLCFTIRMHAITFPSTRRFTEWVQKKWFNTKVYYSSKKGRRLCVESNLKTWVLRAC